MSSSSPHVVVTVEATTSHTLSLSLSLSLCHCTHALYNYIQKCNNNIISILFPKSYLYIYDFRVIYTCVPSNQSDGSEPSLRLSGSPYLPSGGTCFPSTRVPLQKEFQQEMPIQQKRGPPMGTRKGHPKHPSGAGPRTYSRTVTGGRNKSRIQQHLEGVLLLLPASRTL